MGMNLKYATYYLHSINNTHATYTSPAHIITTTPAAVTLTGPSVTTSKLITGVTCETTSVSVGRNSIISQRTIDIPIIRLVK